MLRVTLAALVVADLLTREEAAHIERRLGRRTVPPTLDQCIEEIAAMRAEVSARNDTPR